MSNNFDYADLKQQFSYIMTGSKFTLRRAKTDADYSNYIVSPAIDRLFDQIFGAGNSLVIETDPRGNNISPPEYCPQIPAGVDKNGLIDYLNANGNNTPAPPQNPWYDDENQSIGVIGIGQNLYMRGMVVVAIFSVAAHNDGDKVVQAYIQASSPYTLQGEGSRAIAAVTNDYWSLANSFSSLATSGMLASLQYVQNPPYNVPTLTVCTYVASNLVPADLYFRGEAYLDTVLSSPTGDVAGVDFLFGETGVKDVTQKLEGSISFINHVPTFRFHPSVDSLRNPDQAVSLGHLEITHPLVSLSSEPIKNMLGDGGYIPYASASIFSTVLFNFSGQPVVLPIRTGVTDLNAPALFRLNLSALIKSFTISPDDLNSFFNNHDVVSQLGDFQLSNTLVPLGLSLALSPTSTTIGSMLQYMELGVKNPAPWVIIETDTSILAVDDAELTITLFNPGAILSSGASIKPTLHILVYSEIEIGRNGGIVAFSFDPTQGYVLFSEIEGYISLADIIGLFMGGAEVDVPDIFIDKLFVKIDARNKTYQGGLELTSDWYFSIGGLDISITELGLAMSYSQEKGSQFLLSGMMSLSGIFQEDIAVVAAYPGKDEGWTFAGGGLSNSSNIGDLITNIAEAFGIPAAHIPTVISDLGISELGMAFNTKTKVFDFVVEADWKDTTGDNPPPSASVRAGHKIEPQATQTDSTQTTPSSSNAQMLFEGHWFSTTVKPPPLSLT
ncbi:MAG: hypothetical protein R3E95_01450 [Thiolinea sp.]